MGRAHSTGAMVSLAAWAVQVLYEAASAEKVGLMLDSGLLPGLEYVRVLTPSHPRVCAGEVGGAILCAVQRRRGRHWPVRLRCRRSTPSRSPSQ